MTTEQAIAAIAAHNPALFGTDPLATYRKLAKLVHPDLHPYNVSAHKAFERLASLYAEATGKKPVADPIVIGKWVVGELLMSTEVCDLYSASSKGVPLAAFKIAKSAKDNDLMEQEYSNLGILGAATKGKISKSIERLSVSGRQANILPYAEGFHSAKDLRSMCPGLDFRHVVWMVNRSLTAIGLAHRAGVIHGAVLPEHLLLNPSEHSLVLMEWCYSVTIESRLAVPAIVKAQRALYPAEILRKVSPTAAADIHMLMGSLRDMAAIPKRFRAIFDWCLAASPNARPQDAWQLQDKWKALAVEEYGPPAFVKLEIPVS